MEDLRVGYMEKQAAFQQRFDAEITSLTGIYVLDLQNRIVRPEKDGNSRAANAVEQEIRAVYTNPGRFRSIMLG